MVEQIDGIGAASGASDAASSSFTQARQDAFNAAATGLGMSGADLRTALSSGHTLSQVASSRGISATSLQSTIASSLRKDLPNASTAHLDNIAARLMAGAHHSHATQSQTVSTNAVTGVNETTDTNGGTSSTSGTGSFFHIVV